MESYSIDSSVWLLSPSTVFWDSSTVLGVSIIWFLFLWMSGIPYYGCAIICLSIYLFDGYLHWSYYKSNHCEYKPLYGNIQVFVWTYIFISFGLIPRCGVTSSHSRFRFYFLNSCKLFAKVIYHFAFPPAAYENSSFSTSLQTLSNVTAF